MKVRMVNFFSWVHVSETSESNMYLAADHDALIFFHFLASAANNHRILQKRARISSNYKDLIHRKEHIH